MRTLELETKPVGVLLKQYAIPAIIAMTASSLYNMVDSIFIGRGCGPLAISGLAITFPFMNLAAAFGALVGVGASTLMSVMLGRHDYQAARRVLANVVVLNTILGSIFAIVSLIFLDSILRFFGAGDATLPYASEYMRIILYGNVISHMYFGMNATVRSASHPRRAMIATILTVVLNTILDPLFIFVFGWGIAGAAWATILSQLVSLVWLLISFTNKREEVHFDSGLAGIFRLNRHIVLKSLSIGMSPFCMNVAACMVVIFINKGLKEYSGDLAVGAYGIVNRVTFVILMIVMGLNQGMQPIAGYNYGAKLYDRLNDIISLTMRVAVIITASGFVVCELFPHAIVRLFTTDEVQTSLSVHGMRIAVLIFPILGAQIVISHAFQSIGMAKKAIFLSLSRQVIFLLPALIVLPRWFGVDGIWMSIPFSDAAAAIITWIMYFGLKRELKAEQEAAAADRISEC